MTKSKGKYVDNKGYCVDCDNRTNNIQELLCDKCCEKQFEDAT